MHKHCQHYYVHFTIKHVLNHQFRVWYNSSPTKVLDD